MSWQRDQVRDIAPDTTLPPAVGTGATPAPPDGSERKAWLEWRRGGLGGSDVAALVGLSPWESPWSIWASKCLDLPDKDASEAMEFGTRIEPVMAGYFNDRTGLYVYGEQTWCSHPDEPWMRCTADGFVFDHPDSACDLSAALGLSEWKSTSDPPWDDVPAHYACQAQWSMAVTGLPMCWFGVLHLAFGRPQFRVYELARDEADIAVLTAAARTFWTEHVLTGVPPATDGSDATTEALTHAWEPVDGETVEADDDTVYAIETLRDLKAEAKQIADEIAAHENILRARFGEATVLVALGGGTTLATWKPQDRTTVDVHALAADYPDLAEKYTRTSTSRVLRLTKPKGSN